MKKKQNYWMLIPAKLKDDLDKIQFRIKSHKFKALKCINLLQKEAAYDNFDSLKFRDKPSNWFKKVFNGEYKKDFLDLLIENGIIEANNYYSKNQSKSKSYRINPMYFDLSNTDVSNYSEVSYVDVFSSSSSISILPISSTSLYTPYMLPVLKDINRSELRIYFQTIEKDVIYNMMDTLSVDYNRIINKTKEVVDGISVNSFKVDKEIEETYFEVYNRITNRTYYTTKDSALAYVRKSGHSLIQDKDNFYIEDLDKYVEIKKKNILTSYMTTVKALQKRIYNVSRNTTNSRLDTVFTSMCSYTLDIIKEDNDLIEIDLINSQYAILANWLVEEGCYQYQDVKHFCYLATNGGLYEFIAESLLIKRMHAKKMMMSVCFSSHLSHSVLKDKFADLFPNVHDFIQNYKKNSEKSSAFAVTLQKKESKVFIDGLMAILVDKEIFNLTKHDSLIIKRKDQDTVVKIVSEYFKQINFKAAIKVDDEVIHNGVSGILNQDENNPEYKHPVCGTEVDNGDLNDDSSSKEDDYFSKLEAEWKQKSDKRIPLWRRA